MNNYKLSQRTRVSSAALFIFLVPAVFGCGADQSRDLPRTVPVSGEILLKGKPVLDAFLTFHPQGTGNPAFGKVDENGKFQLTTYEKGDGAVLGQHTVTVQIMPEGAVPGMEAETGKGMSIPKKYNSPATSPLKVTIKDSDNELQLTLE